MISQTRGRISPPMSSNSSASSSSGSSDFSALDVAALPFITVDDEDKFEINPEAIKYLKTLTGKVAVVSIAGVCGSRSVFSMMSSIHL